MIEGISNSPSLAKNSFAEYKPLPAHYVPVKIAAIGRVSKKIFSKTNAEMQPLEKFRVLSSRLYFKQYNNPFHDAIIWNLAVKASPCKSPLIFSTFLGNLVQFFAKTNVGGIPYLGFSPYGQDDFTWTFPLHAFVPGHNSTLTHCFSKEQELIVVSNKGCVAIINPFIQRYVGFSPFDYAPFFKLDHSDCDKFSNSSVQAFFRFPHLFLVFHPEEEETTLFAFSVDDCCLSQRIEEVRPLYRLSIPTPHDIIPLKNGSFYLKLEDGSYWLGGPNQELTLQPDIYHVGATDRKIYLQLREEKSAKSKLVFLADEPDDIKSVYDIPIEEEVGVLSGLFPNPIGVFIQERTQTLTFFDLLEQKPLRKTSFEGMLYLDSIKGRAWTLSRASPSSYTLIRHDAFESVRSTISTSGKIEALCTGINGMLYLSGQNVTPSHYK